MLNSARMFVSSTKENIGLVVLSIDNYPSHNINIMMILIIKIYWLCITCQYIYIYLHTHIFVCVCIHTYKCRHLLTYWTCIMSLSHLILLTTSWWRGDIHTMIKYLAHCHTAAKLLSWELNLCFFTLKPACSPQQLTACYMSGIGIENHLNFSIMGRHRMNQSSEEGY